MSFVKILFFILVCLLIGGGFAQECPYNKKKLEKAESLKSNLLTDLQKDFDALSKADKECLYKSSQDPERIKAAVSAIAEQYVPDIKYVAGLTFGGRKVKCTPNFPEFKYHLDTEMMSNVPMMFEIVNISDFIDLKTYKPKANYYDTISKLKDRLPIKGNSGSDMGAFVNTSMSECFVETMANSQLIQKVIQSAQTATTSSSTVVNDSLGSSSYQALRIQIEADSLKCISDRVYGGPNFIGKSLEGDNLLQSKVQSDWIFGCSEKENVEHGMTSITENMAENALVKKKRELYNQNLLNLYSTLNNLLAGVETNSECSSSQTIRNLIANSASIGIDFLTLNSTPAVVALSQLGAVVVNRVINWGAYLFGDGRSRTDALKEALKTLTPDKNREIFKRYACHLWSINSLGCDIETRKKYDPLTSIACQDNSITEGMKEVFSSVNKVEKVLSPFAPISPGSYPDLTNDVMAELTSMFYKRVSEKVDGRERVVRDYRGRPLYQTTDLYKKFFGEEDSYIGKLLRNEDESLDANQFSNKSQAYLNLKSFITKLDPAVLYRNQDEAIDKEEKAKGSSLELARIREIQQVEFKRYVVDTQSSYKGMRKDFEDLQQGSVKELTPMRYVMSKYHEIMLTNASPQDKPFYTNMLYKTVSDQYVSSKEQTLAVDNLVMASNALQTIEDVNNSLLQSEFYLNFKDDVSEKITSLQSLGERKNKNSISIEKSIQPITLKAEDTVFEQLIYPILQDCLMSFQFGVAWGKDKTQTYPFSKDYLKRCEPLMSQCHKRYNIPAIGKDVRISHYADPSIVDRPYCKVIKNYDEFISRVSDEYKKTGRVCNIDPLKVYQGINLKSSYWW